ncbi:MAG TPA: GatB/YqeY domain-containing protein [Acidimicrobiia bacterium]|nr:GatB/YqeY domain-containing protein [Acidimicrobiia bacterium]
MTIAEQLSAELTDAMKTKDAPRRDVIRQVQTEIATARSAADFTGEVDDDFYERVIASYVKKMDKSRAEYEDLGERGAAMAAKLAYEVDYLSRWLPQTLDEETTRGLVVAAIQDLGVAGDPKAAGRVIGQLMREHGKDLDGGLVNRLVREELGPG